MIRAFISLPKNGKSYGYLINFLFYSQKGWSEKVGQLEGRASGSADLFIDLGFNRFSRFKQLN